MAPRIQSLALFCVLALAVTTVHAAVDENPAWRAAPDRGGQGSNRHPTEATTTQAPSRVPAPGWQVPDGAKNPTPAPPSPAYMPNPWDQFGQQQQQQRVYYVPQVVCHITGYTPQSYPASPYYFPQMPMMNPTAIPPPPGAVSSGGGQTSAFGGRASGGSGGQMHILPFPYPSGNEDQMQIQPYPNPSSTGGGHGGQMQIQPFPQPAASHRQPNPKDGAGATGRMQTNSDSNPWRTNPN